MAWTNYGRSGGSKYHSRKVTVNGHTFDSVKEANRYQDLLFLQQAGEITGLELQKKYVLIPKQTDKEGRMLERECSYYADFIYREADGRCVVEDTKGLRTKEYVIKRKLMLHVHGIRITEI